MTHPSSSSTTTLMRTDDWTFFVSRSRRYAKPHQSGRPGPGRAFRAAVEILQGTATPEYAARMFRPVDPSLAPQCTRDRGVRVRPIRFELTEQQIRFVESLGMPASSRVAAFNRGMHEVAARIRMLV